MTAPVTVAVVSWNTHDLLAECLRSLAPLVESGQVAVWVVDNGSSDGSREMASRDFSWATLVTPERNLGFGPAVNLVAARTESRWIAAANADVALEPGAMEALLATADANPRSGSLAPRLITPDGSTQHSVHRFPGVRLAAAFNLGLASVIPGLGDRFCLEGYWRPERERKVDWAHGAFLLLRRDASDAIGGFDDRQWMYAEDLDLGWRLAREGWNTRYVPTARVHHAVSAATKQAFADERTARHISAAYAWMVRRQGLAKTWAYAACNWLGAWLRAAALLPLANRRPARFSVAHQRALRYTALHRLGLRSKTHLLAAAEAPARPRGP